MAEKRQVIVETYKDDANNHPVSDKWDPYNPTEEDLVAKRQQQAISRGFDWSVRIVDAESGEVVYSPPLHSASRIAVQRRGERLVERYNRTGSFTDDSEDMIKPAKSGGKANG